MLTWSLNVLLCPDDSLLSSSSSGWFPAGKCDGSDSRLPVCSFLLTALNVCKTEEIKIWLSFLIYKLLLNLTHFLIVVTCILLVTTNKTSNVKKYYFQWNTIFAKKYKKICGKSPFYMLFYSTFGIIYSVILKVFFFDSHFVEVSFSKKLSDLFFWCRTQASAALGVTQTK
jgi:hypothetical protein